MWERDNNPTQLKLNIMSYIVRFSNYIQEDIKRGWSSWNFGTEGFEGTKEELLESIEMDENFYISGFDIWVEKIDSDKDTVYINDYTIKELYTNYWVAVDDVNNEYGELSCLFLDSENDEDAIAEGKVLEKSAWGDGVGFEPENYELIYSEGMVNVFREI